MTGSWRFRKSVPLGKFFRLNFNRRSVSLTAGRRRGGPHFTASSNGSTTTSVGLPGSGLSYRWNGRWARGARRAKAQAPLGLIAVIVCEAVIAAVVLRYFL